MAKAETAPLLLKQLGLACMYRHWENLEVEAIEKQWRPAEYLATLCEYEAAARYSRRVQRHTQEAKLSRGKTLTTFNFDAAKSIPRLQIEALASDPSWVKSAKNLVIFGPSGVGKSHIAAAIGHGMVAQGLRVLFSSTTTLVQKLQEARRQYKLAEAIGKLARIPLLILDDIGYVKKDELESSVLFELIADRYENSSLLITANQPFGEWDQIFPDNMMAVAAVDRLIHHASIITIKEKSYRKAQSEAEKSKAKEGGEN
jgi:DNA replication protein DnaC